MGDFSRLYNPSGVEYFIGPSALSSWGQSGKGQFRDAQQVGCTWVEEYKQLPIDNDNTHAFLAYIRQLYRDKEPFTISYLHKLIPRNHPITGSITVNGASQTGSTINVTSGLDKILKAGDLITFANINTVYEIIANMSAPTASSIKISPPIYTGGSPANGAVITYSAVKFRCVIDTLQMPKNDGTKLYSGLVLRFREAP